MFESMDALCSNIPADKVFLHTDRNLYYPGDTVFFQSYVANRFTGEFKTRSHSLWTLLSGPEGEIIDSARFRIKFSQAPGWLLIPDRTKSGLYRLNAFTSIMQNYDPSWAWSMMVKVKDPDREKLTYEYQFDKDAYCSNDTVELSMQLKNSDGKSLKGTAFSYGTVINNKTESVYRAKTTGEGRALMRIYLPDSLHKKEVYLQISLDKNLGEMSIEIPRHPEEPAISFLPESGYLVSAYKQRMAFNALSQDGRQLYLRGVIKDDQGNIIDSVCSGKYGPGVLEFVPERGKNYHAEFSYYPGEHFPLPAVRDDYPSIRVNKGEGFLSVDLLGNYSDETYYLTLSKNFNILALAELRQDKQERRVHILTDSLSAGMARLTLFDATLRAVAERCVIIRRDSAPGYSITPEFEYYLPAQETELKIEITKNSMKSVTGIFSIAVVDSSSGLSPHLFLRSIEDEFLFGKKFYGRVPAHIKRRGLSDINAEELETILLTYGWSRFKRDYQGAVQKSGITDYDRYFIDIDYRRLSGRRRNKHPERNPVSVLAPEESFVIGLNSSGSESLILNIDSIPLSVNNIMIVPDHAVTNTLGARFKPAVNNSYFDGLGKTKEQTELYSTNKSSATGNSGPDIDSLIIIKGISVFAERTPAKKFVNEYEKRYQGLSTKTIDGLAIETAMTFEDMLRRLHPMLLNTAGKTIHFRPTGRIGEEPPPALFVLDGIPQDTCYDYLMDLKPEHIHSVTALAGTGGFYIYGEDAIGGVVFVETKLNNPGSLYADNEDTSVSGGDLGEIIQLFRPEREFYNPPKEVIENDPAYWVRPTLYWNPEVFYDGRNPVKIKYVNHRKKGRVFIIVNGVTAEGEPVYGLSKYKIK